MLRLKRRVPPKKHVSDLEKGIPGSSRVKGRGGCAPRIELAFGDSASLKGIRGAAKRADGTSASADATKKNAPYGR